MSSLLASLVICCIVASAAAEQVSIKLVGGRGQYEGTVYIKYNSTWGLVCDDGWSVRSAIVVCRQLGYRRLRRVTKVNYFKASLEDKILLDDVRCRGYESSIDRCRHRQWLKHNCSPKEAAGVICADIPAVSDKLALLYGPTPAPTTTAVPTTSRSISDKVESHPPLQDAGSAGTRVAPAVASAPSRSLAPGAVQKIAAKESLFANNAPRSGIGKVLAKQAFSRPTISASGNRIPTIDAVELVGGRSSKEGYVRVRLSSGTTGTICSDKWGLFEAMVVCRELGLQYANRATASDFFRGGRVPKVLQSVQCEGHEGRLADCQRNVTSSVRCVRPGTVAGVICTHALPDLVPNITALVDSVSIQDQYLAYLSCALEERCLSSSADTIKEKYPRNWNYISRRLLRFSSSVSNMGTADFRPRQHKSSWQWHSCHMHYHSMDVFTHYDILDRQGKRVAEGHKASFCLEDVECQDGKKKKYSCRGHGDQGISAGCADVYKHDIDCQWIDITDVKPGSYVFQVKVNPQFTIPELSFDNNAVVCDMRYTGYDVKLTNCVHRRG